MISVIQAYGLKFTVPGNDQAIGDSLRKYGEFARPELELLLDLTAGKPGTVVDVGANIGAFTVPLAAMRTRWRVLAYEASPVLAGLLKTSVDTNGLINVRVIAAAAGAAAGEVEFPVVDLQRPGNFGGFSIVRPLGAPTARVPMVTLDSTVPEDVRVIKIDAQGYDSEVLMGASRLLADARPAVIVESEPAHYPDSARRCYEILTGAGYRLHWFFSPFVTPLADAAGDVPMGGDFSMVALPPGMENRWRLPEVTGPDQRRPGRSTDYPYLARYGYAPPED